MDILVARKKLIEVLTCCGFKLEFLGERVTTRFADTTSPGLKYTESRAARAPHPPPLLAASPDIIA